MGGSSRCPTCRPLPRPAPGAGWTPPPGYEPQWRRLAEAALELGLGPEQLAETGLDPLAAARGWKPATVALYSKVARYGGIALPRPPTPEPDPPELDLRAAHPGAQRGPGAPAGGGLVRDRAGLAGAGRRSSGRCAATRCTPPPGGCSISTDDGEWAVPGALTAWHAWETVRDRFPALAASPWVLPALRRGPGLDSPIGGRLSNQALQVTFAKHAVRTAQHLRATAPPVAAGARSRRWPRPTGTCPTTPTAGWRWPPALRRSARGAWCGRCAASTPGRLRLAGLSADGSEREAARSRRDRGRRGRCCSPFGRTPACRRRQAARREADLLVARARRSAIGSVGPRAAPPLCRSRPCRASSGATRCGSQVRYSAGT